MTKKTTQNPSDEELKEQFAEAMDEAIDETLVKKDADGRFISNGIPSELTDEEFWKLKLVS